MRMQRAIALTLLVLVIALGLGTMVAAQDCAPYATPAAADRASAVDPKGMDLQSIANRKWLMGILLVGIVGVTLVDAAVLLILVSNIQGTRGPSVRRLEITNTGNIRSRYKLRAENPGNALRFRWRLDSANGVQRAPMEVPRGGNGASLQTATRAATVVRPRQPAETVDATGIDALRRAAQSPVPQTVRKDAAPVTQLGHRLASAFGMRPPAVSRSLPAPLARVSGSVYSAQREVKRGRWISSIVSEAASAVGLQRPGASSGAQPEPGAEAARTIADTAVETPSVEPGESFMLDLLIDAIRAFGTREYAYKVVSTPSEREAAEPDPSVPMPGLGLYPPAAVVIEDKIRIAGPYGPGRLIPSVVILGVTIAILYLVIRVGGLVMSVW
jgi:hypothetical protein